MKCFRDNAEIEDIDRVIALMKEAERALNAAMVQSPEWKGGVPLRSNITDRLNAQVRKLSLLRMEMQEDGFQYRKGRRLPPPAEGYN